MKTFLTIVSLVAIVLAMPVMAATKKKPGATPTPTPGATMRIIEADALSITVSVGESGNEHFTYKVTDGTKVTLNGAPVSARDLRAGMLARVGVSPDRSAALTVDAKDPPAPAPTPRPSRRRGT